MFDFCWDEMSYYDIYLKGGGCYIRDPKTTTTDMSPPGVMLLLCMDGVMTNPWNTVLLVATSTIDATPEEPVK